MSSSTFGAGRYNLRSRGRRVEEGFRGAAALAESPLLGPLLEQWSDVFDAKVLPLLDPTTRALLGRCGQACRDAVLRSPELPCAGRSVGVKLQIEAIVVSVALLAWAKGNGCPWKARNVVKPPLGAGTYRCCSGHGSAAARGAWGRVKPPLGAGTWRCCSGRASTTASGTRGRVTSPQ
jgi:hypothetical protein